ncbi:MAG: hypothetical protein LC624_06300 [Halobacteriales archaeon]|nr:hypothetical protein [Halobacteriales archaeon]
MELLGKLRGRLERGPMFWGAHLQVFVLVRDAERRVACVQLATRPGEWMMPSENCFDGTDPTQLVRDILPRWFDTPLGEPRLVQAQNYPPEDGDEHWMLVLVYEVPAPAKLAGTPDTTALRFFARDAPPERMFKDHARVWRRLPP